MAWIELHQSLPTHKKTMALMDALDIDVACAVGHLACLWLWALDNAPDGTLTGSARTIARAAQWTGDPQRFFDALKESGYLSEQGTIHDWDDYAGKLLERRDRDREQTRERVRQWRARQHASSIYGSNAVTNALRNAPVTPSNAPTQPNRTQPNRTQPNRTQPNPTEPTERDAPDAGAPAVRSAPKPNKSGELLDLVKAGAQPIAMTTADHQALKKSSLSAAQVAEVYLALARGEHGTEWQQDNLSVSVAIKAWAGYETAKQGRHAPSRQNGRPVQDHVSSLQRLVAREEAKANGAQDVRRGHAATVHHLLPQEGPPTGAA